MLRARLAASMMEIRVPMIEIPPQGAAGRRVLCAAILLESRIIGRRPL